MAMLGPMVVVAENSAADLVDVLGKAGAFPIVEAGWADALRRHRRNPAGRARDRRTAARAQRPALARALIQCIETRGGPVMPVIARVDADERRRHSLRAADRSGRRADERLIARLRSALRIRTLHATVLRRSRVPDAPNVTVPSAHAPNLLDDATVLCVGRGSSYPALSVAIGERVGLIGALSVETAARYLNARDVDGVVIGEGLGPRIVEALLTVLAEDVRFRDLPVGLLGNAGADDERLPNLIRIESDAVRLVERLLPFVRLQAFEARLAAHAQIARDRGRHRSRHRAARTAWHSGATSTARCGRPRTAAARSRWRASPSRA